MLATHHQHGPIVIDPVVQIVPTTRRIQYLPHLLDRGIQLPIELATKIRRLATKLLLGGLSFEFELTSATVAAIVCETEKVEGIGTVFAATLAIKPCKAVKAKQLRLILGD